MLRKCYGSAKIVKIIQGPRNPGVPETQDEFDHRWALLVNARREVDLLETDY